MRIVAALVEIAGFGLVLVGLWLIYPPVALIFGGAGCMAVAVLVDLRGRADDHPRSTHPPS